MDLSCYTDDINIPAKANGTLLTHEMRDQLDEAAISTSKALSLVRRTNTAEEEEASRSQTVTVDDMLADKTKEKDEKKISSEIAVMLPILRFLQLQCENHNRDLQVNRRL